MSFVVTFDTDALMASMVVDAALAERAVVEALGDAAEEVVAEVRADWPKRSGRSAAGWRAERTATGAIVRNDVPYVPHIRQRGHAQPALDEILAPVLQEVVTQVPARAAEAASRRMR